MTRRLIPHVACWGAVTLFLAASIDVHGQIVGQSGAAPVIPLVEPPRNFGLTVTPVFEGWEPNPDGTFSLYFGYLNRNFQEELDIPLGPNNSFDPAPVDRGQPTHFLPRRQKQAFAIVVPKDFGEKKLTWTLTIRGKTERIPGSLHPLQQIDVRKETRQGNTPPTITSAGPNQTVTLSQPLSLSVAVTDADGLPKPGQGQPGLNVRWSKWRGAGKVTFSNPRPPVTGGKAVTTATFSEPGVYVLQVLADDGSMFQNSQGSSIPGAGCCWTTRLVTVTVKGASTAAGPK